MAKPGSNKDRSIKQEEYVAHVYGGERNKRSGAGDREKGDVKLHTEDTVFECKTTGEPGRPAKSTIVKWMEKVMDEAYERGKEPALALQYFMPDSPLANRDGWVNLTVRLLEDDASRSDCLGYCET